MGYPSLKVTSSRSADKTKGSKALRKYSSSRGVAAPKNTILTHEGYHVPTTCWVKSTRINISNNLECKEPIIVRIPTLKSRTAHQTRVQFDINDYIPIITIDER